MHAGSSGPWPPRPSNGGRCCSRSGRTSHERRRRGHSGSADLHIHTLASDGVSSVEEILAWVEASDLDVVAITDHERIDAAVVGAAASRRARGLRTEIIVGEEITTRNGHLVGLFLTERIKPWGSMRDSVARVHDQGGIAIVAHPLVPYPLCASEGTIRRLLDDADAALPPRRHRGVQPHDGADALEPARAGLRDGDGPGADRGFRRAPCGPHRAGTDALPRPHGRGPAGGHRGAHHHLGGRGLRLDRAAGDVPAADGQEPPRGRATRSAARCSGTARVATWATPAAGSGRCASMRGRPALPEGDGRMKIGLVTPYIYPLPGGVNAHVQELYENLVLRGHDVRIISSTHGPQRSSEGDIIRLGYGWSVPTNGSVGTLTVSHRYGQLVQEMLDRERFDLIHYHEPFVPFLSLQVLRHSTSVNVATFHAYSGWSPSYEFGKRMMARFAITAPRPDRGQRRRAPLHRPLLPRRVQGHPQRRGPARLPVDVPPFARWRDGMPNILFIGRFESRKGLMYLLKAYRTLRRDGYGCRLLLVGVGPQERDARRYIATRRLQGVEFLGRVSDADKARAFATADVFVSPATGQESFGIVLLEAMAAGRAIVCSDIHGYKGVVRRGEQALLVPPKDSDALAGAIGQLLRNPAMRAQMGEAGRAARGPVRLGEHHRQGGRLLRLRDPAARGAGGAAGRVPGADPAGAGAADRVVDGGHGGVAACPCPGCTSSLPVDGIRRCG